MSFHTATPSAQRELPGEMALLISLFIVCLCIFYVIAEDITQCNKTSSCSCMGDTGLVDLRPLASNGGPKFKDVKAIKGTDKFSWNPCTEFTEGGCSNAAACQIQSATGQFNIGTQDSAKFEVKAGTLTVTYTAPLPSTRTAIITLVCDQGEEGKITAKGETPSGSGKYLMTLTSKYACQKGSGGGGGGGTPLGLSVGSILVIVAVVLALVYVVAGMSVQKFVRKAEGKEIMPNINFWTALPGLIKDGVLFTVRCGRPGRKYDQI